MNRSSDRTLAGRISQALPPVILLLATLSSAPVSAAGFDSGIINFDYSYPELGFLPYGPGPGAIGSAGDYWNTASFTSPSLSDLMTADGTATDVTWTLTTGSGGGTYNITGVYARLFDWSTTFYTAVISGLTPNAAYDLYLYSTYWDQTLGVNGVAFELTGIRFGTVNDLTGLYAAHTVTANAFGDLEIVCISAPYEPPDISSWQLMPVPEPGSISLVSVAALAGFISRRICRGR
jgi:hypothetical protein